MLTRLRPSLVPAYHHGMSIRPSDVRQYALVGAQTQLDTLRSEVAMLLRTFPELRGRSASGDTSDLPAPKTNGTGRKRAGRPPMTAAQRKAVSQRMAKYWAKRRKDNAGKGATSRAAKATKTAATAA
jgi:hypothetical protein